MMNSVEDQTSCTDDRYLLIIDWLLIFYRTWSNVFKDGKFEFEIDMSYVLM